MITQLIDFCILACLNTLSTSQPLNPCDGRLEFALKTVIIEPVLILRVYDHAPEQIQSHPRIMLDSWAPHRFEKEPKVVTS